jgi:hypothetical protein
MQIRSTATANFELETDEPTGRAGRRRKPPLVRVFGRTAARRMFAAEHSSRRLERPPRILVMRVHCPVGAAGVGHR